MDSSFVLPEDAGVLPAAPDAVGRLLLFEVDVHRLLVGPAEEVRPLEDGVLDVPLLPAQDEQARLGVGRQEARPGPAAARPRAAGAGRAARRRAPGPAAAADRHRGSRRLGGGAAAWADRLDGQGHRRDRLGRAPPRRRGSASNGSAVGTHGDRLIRHGLGVDRDRLDRASASATGIAGIGTGGGGGGGAAWPGSARGPRPSGPRCNARRTGPVLVLEWQNGHLIIDRPRRVHPLPSVSREVLTGKFLPGRVTTPASPRPCVPRRPRPVASSWRRGRRR